MDTPATASPGIAAGAASGGATSLRHCRQSRWRRGVVHLDARRLDATHVRRKRRTGGDVADVLTEPATSVHRDAATAVTTRCPHAHAAAAPALAWHGGTHRCSIDCARPPRPPRRPPPPPAVPATFSRRLPPADRSAAGRDVTVLSGVPVTATKRSLYTRCANSGTWGGMPASANLWTRR